MKFYKKNKKTFKKLLTKFLYNDIIKKIKEGRKKKMKKQIKIKQNKLNKIIVVIGRLLIYASIYISMSAFAVWAFLQNTIY